MSELKQKILDGIRISGLRDWALTVDEHEIVEYEGLTDEDIDELATYILDEIIKKPTLNEDQQIVLEWLKERYKNPLIINPVGVIFSLHDVYVENEHSEVSEAYGELTDKEEAQVLQVFSQWALEQEEE